MAQDTLLRYKKILQQEKKCFATISRKKILAIRKHFGALSQNTKFVKELFGTNGLMLISSDPTKGLPP